MRNEELNRELGRLEEKVVEMKKQLPTRTYLPDVQMQVDQV